MVPIVCGDSFVANASVLALDPVQGVLRPFLDDSPWSEGVQIQIDAGGARVLVVERSSVHEQLVNE